MKASSRVSAPRDAVRPAGVSVASTRPESMSEIRSQRSASFMKWVETKIVTPSFRDRWIRSCQNASRASGSTPEVRLVEDQHLWPVNDRHSKRQSLAHPQGEILGALVGVISESEALGKLCQAPLSVPPRQVKQPGVQIEILTDG